MASKNKYSVTVVKLNASTGKIDSNDTETFPVPSKRLAMVSARYHAGKGHHVEVQQFTIDDKTSEVNWVTEWHVDLLEDGTIDIVEM